MQYKWLKCPESVSLLCNGLGGMLMCTNNERHILHRSTHLAGKDYRSPGMQHGSQSLACFMSILVFNTLLLKIFGLPYNDMFIF